MGRRAFIAAMVLALAVLALAGCGSSGGVSSASPAQVVPAKALAYVEITVRPQGSQSSDAQAALTRLVGYNPIPKLQNQIQKSGNAQGLSYKRDIQPWLGQRIGVVVMGFSNTNVAIVAPTNNTSAALSALDKAARNDHLSPTSYRGVNYQVGTSSSGKPIAIGIVGHNAVGGGPAAFKAIIDASHGGALAGNQTFTGAFGAIDSNAIMRGYVNGPALISALSSSPSIASLPASTRSYLVSAIGSGRFRSSAAFGVTMKPRTITFAIHSNAHGNSSSTAAGVSALPEQSWLAVATGAFNVTQLESVLSATPQSAVALNLFRQRFGIDVVHDVLPALGPIELAIQGNALPALQLGLSVTPSNLAAASRVLGVLYNRAKHSTSVSVRGTPTSFVVTKPGQPLPNVTVAEVGRRVLATFDETFSQFTSPTSTLSSNPAFLRAKSALPGGSHISLFIDFATLASFVSQVPSTTPKAQQILGRLDYFILGSNPGQGEARVVLGLR